MLKLHNQRFYPSLRLRRSAERYGRAFGKSLYFSRVLLIFMPCRIRSMATDAAINDH